MSDQPPQLTNAEHSAQLNVAAQRALLKQIHKRWDKIEGAAKLFEKQTIFFFEEMRLLGQDIRQLTGHEQYGPEDHAKYRDALPKTLHFSAIKKAVYVANTVSTPITTFAECRPVQLALFNYCAGGEPRRLEIQTSHDRNPWSEFVSGAASFTRLFASLNPKPKTEWSREELEKFVETTKPIADQYREAAGLLEEAR